jgi:hypothetical protein
MVSHFMSRSTFATLAGATLLVAASAQPSSAFTLSSPSIAAPLASDDVQPVWWDRWGRWHPNHPWGWRRWGWGPPPPPPPWGYYGYGYGPVRHCWRGPWGAVRCRWG